MYDVEHELILLVEDIQTFLLDLAACVEERRLTGNRSSVACPYYEARAVYEGFSVNAVSKLHWQGQEF